MIGRSLDELPTPCVLVDLDVLERNVAHMAALARQARVRLRPHAKTHKCPQIAALQRAAGACGLSVAKVGEAEVFVAAGCSASPRARGWPAASTASPGRARSPALSRRRGRSSTWC